MQLKKWKMDACQAALNPSRLAKIFPPINYIKGQVLSFLLSTVFQCRLHTFFINNSQ
jgi:hypothetical protein